MKLFVRYLIQIFVCICLSVHVFAQTDMEFWATAPGLTPQHGDMGGRVKHVVVSTLGNPATVTVSIPANPTFQPITVDVPSFTTERIDLFEFNSLIELVDPDVVENKGILIQSTDNITAYIEVLEQQNPDIFALKGRHSLGTEFYVPLQNKLDNQTYTTVARSSIDIVATENNTVVTIIPTQDVSKADGTTYAAGSTITVTLQRGQTYSVRADSEAAEKHPGGTHITATKPIAVSIKDDSVIAGGWDLIGDQLVPLNNLGSQYIVMKGQLNHPNASPYTEFAYVVITEANTTLYANGTLLGTFQPGNQVPVGIASSDTYVVIESDDYKKFYTFHVSGYGGEIAGAILPPTDQCSGNSRIGFSYSYGANGQYLYINIMVQVGAEDGFLVDGVAAPWLNPSLFTTTPDGIWSVARFGPLSSANLDVGAHEIINTKGLFHMGYINYTGPGSLYGYFSDFATQEINAVVAATNEPNATQCFGEEIRLRVDGGFSFSWTGVSLSNPSYNVMQHFNKTDVYNPVLDASLPYGDYKFTVTVGGACGEPPIDKIVLLTIIQGPSPQTHIEHFCEEEIGEGCISLNLLDYESKMTNNWPNTNVIRWQTEVYNQMLMLENYEEERHLSYVGGYVNNLNLSATNPDNTGINPSSIVASMSTRLSGQEINFLHISPRGGYTIDMSKGGVFSLDVYNHVRNEWAKTNGARGVTLRLIGGNDSIEVKSWLTRYDKWEKLTFDFSSFNDKKIYTEMKIIFDVHLVHEQDVFYLDNFQKLVDYQIVTIPNPQFATICNGAEVFALQENDIGCRSNSVFTPIIEAGNFPVNNLSNVLVCETGIEPKLAEHINLTHYSHDIIGDIGIANGNTIIEWQHIFKDFSLILDDFESNRNIPWNTAITAEQSGTVTFNQNIENPNPDTLNSSSTVGMIPRKDANFLYLTADLLEPIDLSEGAVFSIKVAYNWNQDWQKDNAKTVTLKISGSGGTVTSPAIDVKSATNTRYDWVEAIFDFSEFATLKDLDRIELTFHTGNWGGIDWYIDDFTRNLEPFKDTFTDVTDATIHDEDQFFAIVSDPDGCKVEASITFAVIDCGPPAINQTYEQCEETFESGKISGIDLTLHNSDISGGLPNTVEWFTDATRTTPVANPTNAIISHGTTFYIRVTDVNNGKTSESTVVYTIHSLPTITFPAITKKCEDATAFQINGVSPVGGTFSGKGVSSTGTFTPSTAGVGTHTITYSYTDAHNCLNTAQQNIQIMALPNASLISPLSQTYCGTTGTTIQVTNVSGATYNWTKNGTSIPGNHTITNATTGTYEVVVNLDICSETISHITVTGYEVPTYSFSPHSSICEGETLPTPSIELTGTAPWNISYTINGTTTNQSVSTSPYTIPFNQTDPNTYTIQLTQIEDAHCSGTITTNKTEIKIFANPTITFNELPNRCSNGTAVSLSTYATPTGGTFSGNGVSGTNFTPSESLIGEQTITYTLTQNGCTSTQNKTIQVYEQPSVAPSSDNENVCVNSSTQIYGNPSGGSGTYTTHLWSGQTTALSATNIQNPVFTPTTAQTYTYTYTVTDSHNCTTQADITVYGRENPTITFTSIPAICENETPISLVDYANPHGGTWSGDGVNDDDFNPFGLTTSSPVSLTYNFSNTYNCTASATTNIIVNPIPTITLTIPTEVCEYTLAQNLSATVHPLGGNGTWSGIGVTANQFNPSEANIGANEISYTYTVNNCSNSAQAPITVHARPPLTFTLPAEQCSYNTAFELDATPIGGTFTTTYPLEGNTFNPALATFNQSYTITYNYTDPTTNCTNSIDATTIVYHTPPPTTTNNGDVIQNVSTNAIPSLSAVGTELKWYYPTTETQVAENVSTYTPEASVVVDPVSDMGIIGNYTYYVTQTINNCISEAAPSTLSLVDCPAPRPTVLDIEACMNDEDAKKTFTAHATLQISDEIRWYYSPTEYKTGTTYISPETSAGLYTYRIVVYDAIHSCEGPSETADLRIYAEPNINILGRSSICENDSTITLSANPAGGTFSGTGIHGNIFTPTGLPTDIYTITYTTTYGNECIATKTHDIHVLEAPTVTITPQTVCEDATSFEIETTAIPVGGNGIYSSPTIDISSGIFSPTTHGAGTFEITYLYETKEGCFGSDTQTFTVHALPEITIQPIDGFCADVTTVDLTVFAQPTDGTFTGNHVHTTTFNPLEAGAGNHTVTYSVTDANNCTNTADITIPVFELPIITFTPQSSICIDDAEIKLTATTQKTIQNILFSGDGVTNGNDWYFNPNSAPKQTETIYTITVLIEDTDGCSAQSDADIHVFYTEPPLVTHTSAISQNITETNIPAITAIGNIISIYDDISTLNQIGTGNSFTPPASTVIDNITHQGIVGIYTYYFTQTQNNCESVATPGIFTVTDCPVPAPQGENKQICYGETIPTLSVLGNETADIYWKNSHAELLNTASSYTPTETEPGIYTFYVSQFDHAEQCEGPQTQIQLHIFDLPIVSITNMPSNICFDAESILLTGTPTNGEFSYNSTVITDIQPSVIGEGTHTITYSYTDSNECSNSINQDVSVYFTPPPLVNDTTIILYDMHEYLYAQGQGSIRWHMPSTTLVGTGKSFMHGQSTEGIWTYVLNQSMNGCVSESVEKTLTIIDCGTPAPTIDKTHKEICEYEPLPSFTFNNILPELKKLDIYTKDNELVKTILPGNPYTFTPTHSTPRNYAWYIIQDTGCTSPPLHFSLDIYPQPTITITAPATICNNSDPIAITASPEGGTFTGAGITDNIFDPSIGEGFYTINYSYTDINSCSAQAATGIQVHFTPPPIAEDKSGLTVFQTPYLEAIGNSIKWYSDKNTTNLIHSGNIFSTGIQGETDTIFYATQTQNSCISEPTAIRLTLTDCPTPAPISNGFTVCEYQEIPTITALGDTLRWYSSASAPTPIFEGDIFEHEQTNPGVYTYYVSQTNICESPRTTVSFRIAPKPTVSISGKHDICRYDEPFTLTLIPSGGELFGEGISNTEFNPTMEAGNYELMYIYTNSYSCIDTAYHTVSIHETEAPIAHNLTTFTYDLTTEMHAVGTNIRWYDNELLQNKLHDGNVFPHKQTQDIIKEYFVTQTRNSCESEPTKARLQILSCGTPKPILSNDTTICIYQTVPTLTAQGLPNATFHWFQANNPTVEIHEGERYSPHITKEGTYDYFVVQDTACRGEAEYVSIVITSSPKPSISGAQNICEYNQAPQLQVLSNPETIYWFNTYPEYPTEATPIHIGTTFSNTETTPGTHTYYAVRYKNSCVSEPASASYTVTEKPAAPIIANKKSCNYEIISPFINEQTTTASTTWLDPFGKLIATNTNTYTPAANLLQLNKAVTFKAFSTEHACISDTTVFTYTYVARPEQPLVENSHICFGDEIHPITATGVNINWYEEDALTLLLENSPTYVPEISDTAGVYTYWITQKIDGCNSTKRRISFTVAPIPQPHMFGATELCENTSNIRYQIHPVDSATTYTWNVSGDRYLYTYDDVKQRTYAIADWIAPGIDTVFATATNMYGCSNSTFIQVFISPNPIADFEWSLPGADITASFINTSKQDAIQNDTLAINLGFESRWYVTGAKQQDAIIQTWENYSSPIEHSYRYGYFDIHMAIENEYGCKDSITKQIFVNIQKGIYVPNAFSPLNPAHGVRYFEPKGFNIEVFKIWIYDSWGNLVWYDDWHFETDEGTALTRWDGTYNKKPLKADTYIWKIEAIFLDGTIWQGQATNTGKHKNFGSVILLR